MDAPRNAFATASGSGASKSRLMRIRPFMPPGRRGTRRTGTSIATALPLRARMISSPAFDPLQQPGQVSLGLVDVDRFHMTKLSLVRSSRSAAGQDHPLWDADRTGRRVGLRWDGGSDGAMCHVQSEGRLWRAALAGSAGPALSGGVRSSTCRREPEAPARQVWQTSTGTWRRLQVPADLRSTRPISLSRLPPLRRRRRRRRQRRTVRRTGRRRARRAGRRARKRASSLPRRQQPPHAQPALHARRADRRADRCVLRGRIRRRPRAGDRRADQRDAGADGRAGLG